MKTKDKEVKPFYRLSKKDKRIAILKDVLSLIRYNKIDVETGVYCDLELPKYKVDRYSYEDSKTPKVKELENSQLNKLIQSRQVKCTVCAKGALFLGHVDKTNHLKLGETDYNVGEYEIMNKLDNLFDHFNIDLVEVAFECSNSGYLGYNLSTKAVNFGKKYDDDTERLKAIIKNMIKNEGIFIP